MGGKMAKNRHHRSSGRGPVRTTLTSGSSQGISSEGGQGSRTKTDDHHFSTPPKHRGLLVEAPVREPLKREPKAPAARPEWFTVPLLEARVSDLREAPSSAWGFGGRVASALRSWQQRAHIAATRRSCVGSLGFYQGVFVISSVLANVAKISDDGAVLPCSRPLGGPQGHPCTLRTPSSHRTHLALSP